MRQSATKRLRYQMEIVPPPILALSTNPKFEKSVDFSGTATSSWEVRMSISAHEPKSVFDNTRTERTKNSQKTVKTFTWSRTSTQPQLSDFVTPQPES